MTQRHIRSRSGTYFSEMVPHTPLPIILSASASSSSSSANSQFLITNSKGFSSIDGNVMTLGGNQLMDSAMNGIQFQKVERMTDSEEGLEIEHIDLRFSNYGMFAESDSSSSELFQIDEMEENDVRDSSAHEIDVFKSRIVENSEKSNSEADKQHLELITTETMNTDEDDRYPSFALDSFSFSQTVSETGNIQDETDTDICCSFDEREGPENSFSRDNVTLNDSNGENDASKEREYSSPPVLQTLLDGSKSIAENTSLPQVEAPEKELSGRQENNEISHINSPMVQPICVEQENIPQSTVEQFQQQAETTKSIELEQRADAQESNPELCGGGHDSPQQIDLEGSTLDNPDVNVENIKFTSSHHRRNNVDRMDSIPEGDNETNEGDDSSESVNKNETHTATQKLVSCDIYSIPDTSYEEDDEQVREFFRTLRSEDNSNHSSYVMKDHEKQDEENLRLAQKVLWSSENDAAQESRDEQPPSVSDEHQADNCAPISNQEISASTPEVISFSSHSYSSRRSESLQVYNPFDESFESQRPTIDGDEENLDEVDTLDGFLATLPEDIGLPQISSFLSNAREVKPADLSKLEWIAKLIIYLSSDKKSIVEASLGELAQLGCITESSEYEEELAAMRAISAAYECGAQSSIIGAMNKWYEFPEVQMLGCRALHNFGINKNFRDAAGRLGAFETLLQAVHNFPSCIELQKLGSACLCCLAADKKMAEYLVLELNGLESILRIMKKNGTDAFVQLWCCSAINYMSNFPELARRIAEAGSLQVLFYIIQKFTDKTNPDHSLIQNQAREAMKRLL